MIAAQQINYRTKAAYEVVTSVSCPRNVNDVYSLGVSLQYCIRAKYIELEDLNRNAAKSLCFNLAKKQLDIKKEIEKTAHHKLNSVIQYFYDHGGPIIENPISEQMVKEVQPFCNRIMGIFLKSLDDAADLTLNGKMSVEQFDATVNKTLYEMYGALGRLLQVDEIQQAFNDLIDIIQSLS